MKKVLFLFLICLASINNGATQNISTRSEAVAAIECTYLYIYCAKPDSINAHLDRFMNEVNAIVFFHSETTAMIRSKILADISNPQIKKMSVNSILNLTEYLEPDFIPLLGLNVAPILENNLSAGDYEKVCKELLRKKKNAYSGYAYLIDSYMVDLYKKEVIYSDSYANPKRLFDEMCNAYDTLQ